MWTLEIFDIRVSIDDMSFDPEGDENTCLQYGQTCLVARESFDSSVCDVGIDDVPCLFKCFWRDLDWNCWAHLSHWKFEETERKRTRRGAIEAVKSVYHPLITGSVRWAALRTRTGIHYVGKRWFSLTYDEEYVLEFDKLYLDDECNLQVTRKRLQWENSPPGVIFRVS